MDFKFNLNNYLSETVTVVGPCLLPLGYNGSSENKQKLKEVLTEIIDTVGAASGIAQELTAPVTTSAKLINSDHVVYVMIDKHGNNGYGSVVGILKTGWKDLFVYDKAGVNHKIRAYSVLDFYVHESRQRQGYGKYLFDYMLRDNQVEVQRLPLDRPSEKFLHFLLKHYGLRKIIPQSNNFVVFEEFFNHDKLNLPNGSKADGSKKTFDSIPNYGRHGAFKPLSTIGDYIGNNDNNQPEKQRVDGMDGYGTDEVEGHAHVEKAQGGVGYFTVEGDQKESDAESLYRGLVSNKNHHMQLW